MKVDKRDDIPPDQWQAFGMYLLFVFKRKSGPLSPVRFVPSTAVTDGKTGIIACSLDSSPSTSARHPTKKSVLGSHPSISLGKSSSSTSARSGSRNGKQTLGSPKLPVSMHPRTPTSFDEQLEVNESGGTDQRDVDRELSQERLGIGFGSTGDDVDDKRTRVDGVPTTPTTPT